MRGTVMLIGFLPRFKDPAASIDPTRTPARTRLALEQNVRLGCRLHGQWKSDDNSLCR